MSPIFLQSTFVTFIIRRSQKEKEGNEEGKGG
jgi:hypothetical protein